MAQRREEAGGGHSAHGGEQNLGGLLSLEALFLVVYLNNNVKLSRFVYSWFDRSVK